MRDHTRAAFTSVTCTRSSAMWRSPVSRNAVRSNAADLDATNATYDGLGCDTMRHPFHPGIRETTPPWRSTRREFVDVAGPDHQSHVGGPGRRVSLSTG